MSSERENKNVTATGRPRQWTEKQLALLEWDANLSDDDLGEKQGWRNPPTLTALAEKLGVDRRSLADWRKLPGYKDALRAMQMRVMLEYEPRFLRKVMAVLDRPGLKTYDKVLKVYWQYIRPVLLDAQQQGLLDSVQPHAALSSHNDTAKRIEAGKMFEQLPPDQRQQFLEMLQMLGELPPEPGDQAIASAGIEVSKQDEGWTTNQDSDILTVPVGKLLGTQRRRKVSLYPIGDDEEDNED